MRNLEVIYDAMTYYKIMHWVQKAGREEISGFGKVTKDGPGRLKVIDAFLLPQRNGAAHTDIEPEDLGRLEYQERSTPGELRLWWHSHVQMNCYWSKTDTDTIEELGKHGWILATVFNQKWEHRTAMYIGGEHGLFLDNLNMRPVMQLTQEMEAPWDAAFKTNITDIQKKHAATLAGRFKEWRNNKHLSKRERRHLTQNRVLGIFDTEDYGKVIWTEEDDKRWKKEVPAPKNKHLMLSIDFWDVLQKTKEVRWASDQCIRRMENVGEFWTSKAVKDFLSNVKAVEAEEKKTLALPPDGKPRIGKVLIGDEEHRFDENQIEEELREIYPDWEKLPFEERIRLRRAYLWGDDVTEEHFGNGKATEIPSEEDWQRRAYDGHLN